jgi:hypothetical protein
LASIRKRLSSSAQASLLFFPEEFQFPQMMLVAERVQAILISKEVIHNNMNNC